MMPTSPNAYQVLRCVRHARQFSTGGSRPRGTSLSTSLVPEGWPKGPTLRFDLQAEPTFLPRDIDSRVDDLILRGAAGTRSKATAIVLDGARGVGKSSVMLRTVLKARESGVITMYVPSARDWTHGSGFFSATTVESLDPITHGAAAVRWYDRPAQTLKLMSGLLDVHGDALADVPCGLGSEIQETAGANNVRELVEFGVKILRDVDSDWRSHPQLGCSALDAVVGELSAQQDVPFMIAIDDYGSLLGLTDLVSQNQRCVHATGIRAVSELFGRDALPKTLSGMKGNSTILLALGASHGAPKWRKSRVEGTADYPISADVRQDPTGVMWLTHLREMAMRTREIGETTNLLDEDLSQNPTAVSAAAFVSEGVKLLDVPEWTTSEAGAILVDFQRENRLKTLESAEKMRIFELAGGRADILHRLCMRQ